MATITAQNILDENNWTTSSISLANVERLVNNAIDYINLQTGLSIASMAAQTVTVTNTQSPVIKAMSVLMIKAYLDRGPNVSISGLGVATILQDPQYTLYKDLVEKGINRLLTRSFLTT